MEVVYYTAVFILSYALIRWAVGLPRPAVKQLELRSLVLLSYVVSQDMSDFYEKSDMSYLQSFLIDVSSEVVSSWRQLKSRDPDSLFRSLDSSIARLKDYASVVADMEGDEAYVSLVDSMGHNLKVMLEYTLVQEGIL